MTPAIRTLEKANVTFRVHEYEHDPAAEAFGLEAAAKLGVDPARMFKTLVVKVEGKTSALAIGVVPVSAKLDVKALAGAVGGKKGDLADPAEAERATGYVVGGISPLGTRKRLPTVIDDSALTFETVYVSAGRRGMQIEVGPGELVRTLGAKVGPIASKG